MAAKREIEELMEINRVQLQLIRELHERGSSESLPGLFGKVAGRAVKLPEPAETPASTH